MKFEAMERAMTPEETGFEYAYKWNEAFEEESLEQAAMQFNAIMEKGRRIARANGMNLTVFKKEITKAFSIHNDEDQWTFDYESYLTCINGVYLNPVEWGNEFYSER